MHDQGRAKLLCFKRTGDTKYKLLFGSEEKMSRYHFLEGFVREGEIQ